MDQRTRERWLIPVVISLATGVPLGVAFLYLNAWATGATLRPPFTLGWLRSILVVQVPLWGVMLFAAAMAVVVLYVRERAEKSSASDVVSGLTRRPSIETECNDVDDSATSKLDNSRPIVPPAIQALAPAFDGDSLVVSSPDQFSLRVSKVDSGTVRGIELFIENHRLTSIHQIRVILSSACSFDGRQRAFRESIVTGQTFTRPNLIRPSCSGQPILLVWKAPQGAGLVTGENNNLRQLLWPDMDKSEVERWKIALRALAHEWPAKSNGQSTPLKELSTELIVLWSRAQNEFSIEELGGACVPPDPPAAFPLTGGDGSHREVVRYIVCGQDQLWAYTTTRENNPGTRFLVVRMRPDRDPQSLEAPDRNVANAKWNEWYQEWEKRGFGGASGNVLDRASPF